MTRAQKQVPVLVLLALVAAVALDLGGIRSEIVAGFRDGYGAGSGATAPGTQSAATVALPSWGNGAPSLQIDIPRTLRLTSERGADFDVHRLEDSTESGSHRLIGVYVGHHPHRFAQDDNPLRPSTVSGAVAGRPVTWLCWTTRERGPFCETLVEGAYARFTGPASVSELILHVWVEANAATDLASLRRMASSLRPASPFGVASARAQEPGHLISPNTWMRGPVAPATLNARIESAAQQYRSQAPIPGVAFWDVAYPADSKEFAQLHGNALLLVIAIAQDSAQLPLARTYIRTGRSDTSLGLVTGVFSRTDSGSAVQSTFGAFRYDALYLLPVQLARGPSTLLADFTSGRQELLAIFEADRPSLARHLPMDVATPLPAASDAFKRFLRRAYPGFIGP